MMIWDLDHLQVLHVEALSLIIIRTIESRPSEFDRRNFWEIIFWVDGRGREWPYSKKSAVESSECRFRLGTGFEEPSTLDFLPADMLARAEARCFSRSEETTSELRH